MAYMYTAAFNPLKLHYDISMTALINKVNVLLVGGEHIPGAPPPPGLGPHLPPGISQGHLMNAAAAREQELVYRDLMNRAPYNSDPLLAQQVSN